MTGTPRAAASAKNSVFEDIAVAHREIYALYEMAQSMGTTQWVYVPDVPAGPLVLLCFFPDLGDGMPHALHGMYAIVEVAG